MTYDALWTDDHPLAEKIKVTGSSPREAASRFAADLPPDTRGVLVVTWGERTWIYCIEPVSPGPVLKNPGRDRQVLGA